MRSCTRLGRGRARSGGSCWDGHLIGSLGDDGGGGRGIEGKGGVKGKGRGGKHDKGGVVFGFAVGGCEGGKVWV